MNLLQKQLLRYANSVCMTNIANDLVRCQERLEISLSTYRPKYPSTYVEYPTRICVLVVVSLFVNCQGKSPRLLLRQVRLQLIHCLWFHAQSSKFCLPRWMCISSKDLCPETTSKIKKTRYELMKHYWTLWMIQSWIEMRKRPILYECWSIRGWEQNSERQGQQHKKQ